MGGTDTEASGGRGQGRAAARGEQSGARASRTGSSLTNQAPHGQRQRLQYGEVHVQPLAVTRVGNLQGVGSKHDEACSTLAWQRGTAVAGD